MGIKNEILQEAQLFNICLLVLNVWAQQNVTGPNFTKIFLKTLTTMHIAKAFLFLIFF